MRQVIDWPDGKIALQSLEGLLRFSELDVESPKLCQRLSCEIGTQQIPAFVTAAGAKPLAPAAIPASQIILEIAFPERVEGFHGE